MATNQHVCFGTMIDKMLIKENGGVRALSTVKFYLEGSRPKVKDINRNKKLNMPRSSESTIISQALTLTRLNFGHFVYSVTTYDEDPGRVH